MAESAGFPDPWLHSPPPWHIPWAPAPAVPSLASQWNLVEWKQTGVCCYVVGTEPANCLPEGRCAARENGRLESVTPGAPRAFDLEAAVLSGREEIAAIEHALP